MVPSSPFGARTNPMILAVALALSAAVQAQDNSGDAMQLATAILTEGARRFDAKDAAAMAATYTDDAEIQLSTREENGGIKVQLYKGKEEIRKVYDDYFKEVQQIKSKNTVEFARLIQPDVLIIHGNFRPDTDSDPMPFIQVRVKRGEKWLMLRLQFFVLGPP